MKKIVFIAVICTLSILNSSELCNSKKPNLTRSEVHTAQQCLKNEIKQSIEIGKEYTKYHNDVEDALKTYYSEYDMCVTMYAKYQNHPSQIRKQQFNECVTELEFSSKEVGRLERQYGLLSDDYKIFKSSIEDLKSTLELLKMKYKQLLED